MTVAPLTVRPLCTRRRFLAACLPIAGAFVTTGCAVRRPSTGGASIGVSDFGALADGRIVKVHTLQSRQGMVARVMDYGAVLTDLRVPDRSAAGTNVVLGFDRLQTYLDTPTPFGATIGRVANRIAGGRFQLDGREIRLVPNSGPHQLHGGRTGFHRRLWSSRALPVSGDTAAVELRYRSADGEEGFPGTCEVMIRYSLTGEGELRLDYSATTDTPTPINLTNHSYFNLTGRASDVLGHELQLFAGRYTVADADLIPTGDVASVAGTGLDFRTPTRIGARISEFYPSPGGYDHNYVIDGAPGHLNRAARVVEPVSGRVMECWTTQPGVQLYTANWAQPQRYPGTATTYPRHGAFCLETQHFPDSVNHPAFPSTILRPGQVFQSTTIYRFSSARG